MLSASDISILAQWHNYARYKLGLDLYPWQEDVLRHLDHEGSRYLLTCCNEGGKTSTLAAPLAVIHAETIPGSSCYYTSASDHQIHNQFLPAFRRFAASRTGWVIREHVKQAVYLPTGSTVFFLKSDDPGKMEGFHATGTIPEMKSLLVIADEAKSIPDSIYGAIVRCSATRFLAISSTSTETANWFHTESTAESCPANTRRRTITWLDCPHLCDNPKVRAKIESEIASFGPDHPLMRSKYYSEWPRSGRNIVFDMQAVGLCMSGQIPHVGIGRRGAGLDLSGGGDEQVVYCANGNRVSHPEIFHEEDAYRFADLVIPVFERNYIPAHCVRADGTGLGKPICQVLSKHGWNVSMEIFSESAYENHLYANRRTEMAFLAARVIKQLQVILPSDAKTKQQLGWFRWRIDEKGKLALLPKEKMPHSPDRADSLIMLLCNMPDWGLAPKIANPAAQVAAFISDDEQGGSRW